MNRDPTRPPEHERCLRALREMVLFGDLAPGEAITVAGIADRLGAGTMPVREAVRRLDSEGALERMDNRRLRVPPMTPARLAEIRTLRMAVEPVLAERAAGLAVGQGHAPILAAELAGIDTQLDHAIAHGDIRGYLRFNFKFHFHLYAAARAPVLERVALSMWLQIAPSLRIMCGHFGTGNLPDEHRRVVAEIEGGAPEAAGAAIARDIAQGMDGVATILRSGFGHGI